MRLDPHIFTGSVLLAVSGGIDSVVMSHYIKCNAAALCKDFKGCAIAHCNFHLRGAESDADEAFVREWAGKLGLPCHVKHFDTAGFAAANGISIEMAARELRYRWFDELCRKEGYSAVCVAHNANDNAETLLLNLLRGTGLNGICGMAESAVNPYGSTSVYRPMLEWDRKRIEAYAKENGLSWRTDSTNLENSCKRNIIRNQVFPLLEKINPSFVDTFADDMSHFRMAASDDSWKAALAGRLAAKGFNRSTIRDFLTSLDDDSHTSGKQFHSKSHVLITTQDGLRLASKDETADKLPKVELIPWTAAMNPKVGRGVTLLDASKTGGKPVLRHWEQGDYLYPIGLRGKKKVSDLFTDLKYNLLDKQRAYVVADPGARGELGHVLAVVGERTDSCVAVDSSTTMVYRITK